ncbi:hypothetical protein HWV62_34125, partial [Athelia sp. TMB]
MLRSTEDADSENEIIYKTQPPPVIQRANDVDELNKVAGYASSKREVPVEDVDDSNILSSYKGKPPSNDRRADDVDDLNALSSYDTRPSKSGRRE